MKVLAIDIYKCTGCHSCKVACSAWNTGEVNLNNSLISIVRVEGESFYYPSVCQQCNTANCALVCPAGAISRNSHTNALEINKDLCIGCKLCILSCPLGALHLLENKSYKCNLCDGHPKCVEFCDYGALQFVEVEQLYDKRMTQVAGKILISQKELLQNLKIPDYKGKNYDGLGKSK